MSVSELHAHAKRFQARVRRRNLTEYLAFVFVLAVFGFVAFVVPVPGVRFGIALIIAGCAFACWRLSVQARPANAEDHARAKSLVDFHRSELTRQRDALASVWLWYIAPLVPGVFVFAAAVAFAMPAPILEQLTLFAVTLGFTALVFGAVIALNAWGANRLGAELDALNDL